MAIGIQHLDLEEQEQLDKLKAFWAQWGNLISAVLIFCLLAFSAWRAYDWYMHRQAMQASALYDQIATDAASADTTQLTSSLKMMQDNYGKTTFAQQAGLLAAKVFYQHQQPEQSKAALQFVIDKGSDQGLASVARLQLAQQLAQEKAFDQAAAQLQSGMATGFAALADDGLGDIYNLQGKKAEAIAAYTKAWKGLAAHNPYRDEVVGIKLAALGVDTSDWTDADAPASAASAAGTPAASAAPSSRAQ